MSVTDPAGKTTSFTYDPFGKLIKTTDPAGNTVTATYDPATKVLTWEGSFSGLTGPATAAHFHGPAEAGKNAGVAIPIPGAANSPAEGSATLTDAQAADLLAG